MTTEVVFASIAPIFRLRVLLLCAIILFCPSMLCDSGLDAFGPEVHWHVWPQLSILVSPSHARSMTRCTSCCALACQVSNICICVHSQSYYMQYCPSHSCYLRLQLASVLTVVPPVVVVEKKGYYMAHIKPNWLKGLCISLSRRQLAKDDYLPLSPTG